VKHWKTILALLMLVALVVTSCAPAATPTAVPTKPAAKPTEKPSESVTKTMVIGYTASLTGSLEVSAGRQSKGLQLWMKQLNDAGGITLSDGTIVKFDAATYDDESNKERVQELYTRLATEDNADLLISPYSSGLTAAASVIAEQYGKVMITTGAAADSNYKQGYTQVFQIYTAASRYLTGAIDLLKMLDPSVKKLAIVHEDATFATSVVEAAKEYAESLGYEIVIFEGYAPDTADFGPFINKIQATGAEAILGGGHLRDGSTFARQVYEKDTDIKLFTLLVAPPEPDFAELGEAAYAVIGPSQWEPLAAFTPESAKEAGLEWFGLLSDEFVETYEAAYNEEPSYHSGGGYAAGLVLQKAIIDAGSTDPAAIKSALDDMNILTFFGQTKFDTSEESHGLQIGHSMVYIQWQRDADGNLLKQVVWPLEGATAETIYPIP
jgi:branched-chain amino acid transport system substrate-binding protein